MKKILVVNINWLGDAIFSIPVFKALKKFYPQAHVACLCVPRLKEVLDHCSFIDEIIVYDEKGKDAFLWQKLGLIARLRHGQFDTAFFLHRSASRALLVYLSCIPRRIGYGKYRWLLTHPINDSDVNLHRSDYYLRVLEPCGITIEDRLCELNVDDDEMASLNVKLHRQGIGADSPFVVFNVGGNWDLKRWPLSCWAELVQRVTEKAPMRIVFSGASNDRASVLTIIEEAKVGCVNMAGETTLGESLALFAKAQYVVSGDSGPLHLANSVGAKVVGIFGPTQPSITGPRGSGQRVILLKEVGCNKAPCYHLSCKNNVCMQAVSVNDVWEAICSLNQIES